MPQWPAASSPMPATVSAMELPMAWMALSGLRLRWAIEACPLVHEIQTEAAPLTLIACSKACQRSPSGQSARGLLAGSSRDRIVWALVTAARLSLAMWIGPGVARLHKIAHVSFLVLEVNGSRLAPASPTPALSMMLPMDTTWTNVVSSCSISWGLLPGCQMP